MFVLSFQSVLQATSRGQQDGSELLASLQIQSGSSPATTNNGQSLQIPSFAKRQGVSGESSDQHNRHNHHHATSNRQTNNQQQTDISLLITSHDKDFRWVFTFCPTEWISDQNTSRINLSSSVRAHISNYRFKRATRCWRLSVNSRNWEVKNFITNKSK